MVAYYAGWLVIFIIILTITHILSKHTREIFLWTIKISIAIIITGWLGLAVYVSENLDIAAFNEVLQRMYDQIIQLRSAKMGL
jgi:hypothetical protein